MKPKVGHQRFIALGISNLQTASQFINSLESYIGEVKDPSLLAITGEQAMSIMNFMTKHNMHNPFLMKYMQERHRISERQGAFSLQRKREIKEQRLTT